MLEIARTTNEKGALTLNLKGALTIETVDILKAELIDGFANADHLMIDGHDLTEIDFFGVQLLCSAHRTSIAWLKLLTWQDAMPQRVRECVQRIGFLRNHGCSLCPSNIDCMWLCGPAAVQQPTGMVRHA